MLLHIVALSGLPRAAREGKSQCTSNFQVSACFTFATVSLDKVNHSQGRVTMEGYCQSAWMGEGKNLQSLWMDFRETDLYTPMLLSF